MQHLLQTAHLAAGDPIQYAASIVQLVMTVQTAALQVCQNREDCNKLSLFIGRVAPVLEELQHQLKTGSRPPSPAIRRVLDGVCSAVMNAGDLVESCRSSSSIWAVLSITSRRQKFVGICNELSFALQGLSTAGLTLTHCIQEEVGDLRKELNAAQFETDGKLDMLRSQIQELKVEALRESSETKALLHRMMELLETRTAPGSESDPSANPDNEEVQQFLQQEIARMRLKLESEKAISAVAEQDLIERDICAIDLSETTSRKVPAHFFCPITLEVMEKPTIINGYGHSYERLAIEQWLCSGGSIEPIEGVVLSTHELTSNITLEKTIRSWFAEHSVPVHSEETLQHGTCGRLKYGNVSQECHASKVVGCNTSNEYAVGGHCDGGNVPHNDLTEREGVLTASQCGNQCVTDDAPDTEVLPLSSADRLGPSEEAATQDTTDRGSLCSLPQRELVTADLQCCCFSSNGELLAGGGAHSLTMWVVSTGERRACLPVVSEVFCCAASASGTTFASGHANGKVELWDAASCKATCTLRGHSAPVHCCAFNPEVTHILVSGGGDGLLKVWDTVKAGEVCTLSAHDKEVTCCAFTPTGHMLVSASLDGAIKLWDSREWVKLTSVRAHAGGVWCCAVSPDGGSVVSSGSDSKMLKLWSIVDGEVGRRALHHIPYHRLKTDSWVYSCAWAGTLLVCGHANGNVRLWRTTESWQEAFVQKLHHGEVRCCSFTSDGTVLFSGSSTPVLHLWDVSPWQRQSIMPANMPHEIQE